MSEQIAIRIIQARETHELRLRVLRPGQSPERADYSADADPDAFHLGAFDDGGALVGVASFYRERFVEDVPPTGQADWRLRGMAVEPAMQGRGVGRALLASGLERLRAENGRWLWCNARPGAAPFYTALGFATVGDAFEMPDIGTHFLMARRVRSQAMDN